MKKLSPESAEKHKAVIEKASAYHHNLLFVLSVYCLVKTLTCKRFQKAVDNKVKPPKDLVNGLANTMKMARDQGLAIPGCLQARASKYIESKESK